MSELLEKSAADLPAIVWEEARRSRAETFFSGELTPRCPYAPDPVWAWSTYHWSTGWENNSNLPQPHPIQLYKLHNTCKHPTPAVPRALPWGKRGKAKELQNLLWLPGTMLVQIQGRVGVPPSTANATVAHLFHCCLAAGLVFEIILITSDLHTMQRRTWVLVLNVPPWKSSDCKTSSFIFCLTPPNTRCRCPRPYN